MRTLVSLSLLLAACAFAQETPSLAAALAKPVLAPNQPLVEVQVYTAARTPLAPNFSSASEWQGYSAKLRERILSEVVYRGEAARWRNAPLRVEWLETMPGGPDYQIRKLRLEALPGLWIAGLLYRPVTIAGRTPAVLNVNGHEQTGTFTPYIQERCIHLARSGLLALNLEWYGRGNMPGPGLNHYKLAQIDLTGTSGLAVFYLAMKKGLDVLESLPETDRERIAVTGLSGGAWQTIWIGALDERVALTNPVAGYSSFVTRSQWPELDLGDAEQTPSDFASIADYTHLTALLAPRWAQLANNANDTCCFRADYALGPLVQVGRHAYHLLQRPDRLRYHINFGNGHNYDEDNRRAFYALIRDGFFAGNDFPLDEKPLGHPVRTGPELAVKLPPDNLDFHTLALKLAKGLPQPAGARTRERLRTAVRAYDYTVEARQAGEARQPGMTVRNWRLKMGGAWTVPAVEFAPANPKSAAILVADQGRASAAEQVRALTSAGTRVVALDPFYFGESKIAKRDFLYAILIAALGDRPLGLQASQILAAARWLKTERPAEAVRLVSVGPRTSLGALIAAALDGKSVDSLQLNGSYGSLHEILQQDLASNQTPELFCFGLLKEFDIPQIAALAAPKEVEFVK